MTLEQGIKVGVLAAKHPLSTRVFARHQIDFCCGGGQPLDRVCREKGLDPDRILAEITQELEGPTESPTSWLRAPLPDLVSHILNQHHEPLVEELPRLEGMARKVLAVHGEKDPERLEELLTVFVALRQDLEQHMREEETALFPLILAGRAPGMEMLDGMREEHEAVGHMLARLNQLTDGYRVPAAACNTWRALWHGLAALEPSLHEHIHLENNILFPRAIAEAH